MITPPNEECLDRRRCEEGLLVRIKNTVRDTMTPVSLRELYARALCGQVRSSWGKSKGADTINKPLVVNIQSEFPSQTVQN
jgi:hypothetical protein